MTKTPDLIAVGEIADLLGVTRQHAYYFSTRADFPAPALEISVGRLWHRREVEAWLERWQASPTGRRALARRRARSNA